MLNAFGLLQLKIGGLLGLNFTACPLNNVIFENFCAITSTECGDFHVFELNMSKNMALREVL